NAEFVPAVTELVLLLQVPSQVESVDPVEQPEEVAFAPDNLLLAEAEAERDLLEVDVDVGLAELVLELAPVPVARREVADLATADRAAVPDRTGDRSVEARLARVAVTVVVGQEAARSDVVHAVVDPSVEQVQVRRVDETDAVLAEPAPTLDPVVVETNA